MRALRVVTAAAIAVALAALTVTPAEAAVDTSSYKGVTLAAHTAGLAAAGEKGALPTPYTQPRGTFLVPNATWYTSLYLYSFTSGIDGTHEQNVAYAVAASQKLRDLGFHLVARYVRAGDGTFSTYGSPKLRCTVTATPLGSSVGCATTARLAAVGASTQPFVTAYKAKVGTVAGRAFAIDEVRYGTKNYMRGAVTVTDVLTGVARSALFYKVPGAAWTFLMTTQVVPQCTALEKYVSSSRAWAGESCLRAAIDSTVVAR